MTEWGRRAIRSNARDSEKQTRYGFCGRCGRKGKCFLSEFGPVLRWLCGGCSTHHSRLADSIDAAVTRRAA